MDPVVGNGTDLACEVWTESTGLTDYGMYCTMHMLRLQASVYNFYYCLSLL
jgi:hypothetical protein